MKWEDSGGRKPVGIGIDILSRKRADAFLERHRNRILERLLTVQEKERYLASGRKMSPLLFTKLFAAKEAYFKACGGDWMGIEGFGKIDIAVTRSDAFTADSDIIQPPVPGVSAGAFITHPQYVIAEVVIWQAEGAA